MLFVRRNDVWKKLFSWFVFIIILGAGILTGYFFVQQPYEVAREHTEQELGQLRAALTDAQVRSDTAIRGLDEAITGIGAIQDRNRRITVLIDTIGATVGQLRAIYERSSATLQTVGAAEKPVEVPSDRN
jgi:hypothetical protein